MMRMTGKSLTYCLETMEELADVKRKIQTERDEIDRKQVQAREGKADDMVISEPRQKQANENTANSNPNPGTQQINTKQTEIHNQANQNRNNNQQQQ